MEQRSQILKQMHLTKNEREREVSCPGWALRASGCCQLWACTGLAWLRAGMLRPENYSSPYTSIAGLPGIRITHHSCPYHAFQPRGRGALAGVADSALCMRLMGE